jgi:hypothetical protein
MTFTKDCLQAINDWQRGGNHKQKLKRGQKLKREALLLADKFRTCDKNCFRQEAHQKGRVWQLLADNKLPETIAAWTTDLTVAKAFKGGVPPHDLQGVIFSLLPPAGSIIVNLAALYADSNFLSAINTFKSEIVGFSDGIGRYWNSQQEIVLEVGSLTTQEVLFYGGYSSSRDRLRIDGRTPTQEELEEFDALCLDAGITLGSWWLSADGTQKVLSRMKPHISRLKK